MEKKSKKIFGECYEPDVTHNYNFMLDTTAINKLAENPQDVQILKKASENLGYEYFRCRIQDDEVIGLKSDGSLHKHFSNENDKSKKMRNIVETLDIRKISCLAKFVERGIASKGIDYLKNSNGKLFDVFTKVFNENIDNLEDAIIVESGIRYNCLIISNDKAMCENTNCVFEGRAMWYKKFIEGINLKL